MKRNIRLIGIAANILIFWFLAMPISVYAAGTIGVNTPIDEFGTDTLSTCSLREAIQSANTDVDFGGCTRSGTAPYAIDLPAGTYTLVLIGASEDANETGDLDIHATVEIVGAGAESTIIQAGLAPGIGIDRVFHVTAASEVSISGVTVRHGTTEAGGSGGGIANTSDASVTIVDSIIAENSASGNEATQGGGGLWNDGGTLILTETLVLSNTASGTAGSGGGILNLDGILNIGNSTLTGNSAMRAGGGIESNVGTVMLDTVDFSENSTGAAPGNGGALHVTGAGMVTATGGTVTNNSAALEGGGFWNGSGTMTVDGTTFNHNMASGAAADDGGGALFNNGGTLIVVNAMIADNVADGTAGSGGGILNLGGTLQVSDSMIENNSAVRAGGGIEDNVGVMVTLTRVDLNENSTGSAPGNGGALHITGAGTVHVSESIISGNVASAEGGGLWNSAVGTLIVDKSTLNNNIANGVDADQGGGGLFNDGGVLKVSNSTVSTNAAVAAGGGLQNLGSATLINVTVYENSADGLAGGIASSGSITLSNSIVAHLMAMGDDCSGVNAGDFNLDSDGSCGAAITANPLLDELQANGGNTLTHAPADNSPAIGAGNNDICAADPINNVDQRGLARPIGPLCDLGSHEVADDGDDDDQERNVLLISPSNSGMVDGVHFDDEDVLAYDFATGSWVKFFDGSDLGLRANDVNAVTVHDGRILMSFNRLDILPGAGKIDDSDIVEFIPDTLGETTAGTFALYFDGSDVGLSHHQEDIDTIAFTADGDLVISLLGDGLVHGFEHKVKDEDLIVFTADSLGEETSGSFKSYFDGSAVDLTLWREDIWGAWVEPKSGDLYLATKGAFEAVSSNTITGESGDIFICTMDSPGDETACTFAPYFVGGMYAYINEQIDGFALIDALPAAYEEASMEASTTPEEASQSSEDDGYDDIADKDDSETYGEDALHGLYLPNIKK